RRRAAANDQVPRLEKTPRADDLSPRLRLWCRDRRRHVHRHNARGPGAEAPGRLRHGGRHGHLLRGARPVLRHRRLLGTGPWRARRGDRRAQRVAGAEGVLHRGLLREVRYLQPHNGERVDAIRDAIEERHRGSWLYPIVLTSLLEAADRVDSTTGLQMAYLKQWAPRSFLPLSLRVPELLAGPGRSIRADAREVVASIGPVDFAYLDPPYNQHRYFTNYHVWETLIRWDAPDHYGVACKRADARNKATHSEFNSKLTMPAAPAETVR